MKILIISLLSVATFLSNAQTKLIDSLRIEVNAYEQRSSTALHDDTIAVTNLLRLGEKIKQFSTDSAFHYINKAAVLAEKIDWTKGSMNAAYIKANVHYGVTYDFNQAVDNYRTAANYAEQLYPDKNGGDFACRVYYYISNCYSYLGNTEQAKEEILTSLSIAELIDHKKWQLNAYNVLGSISRNENNYKQSVVYYEKCLSIILEIQNKGLEAILYGNIALSYNGLSDYHKALEYLEKAVAIDSALGVERGLIRHYNTRSNTYRYLGELDKAIVQLERGEQLAIKLNEQYSLGNISSSLAIIYNIKGDYDKAIEFNKRSLNIFEQFNDVRSIANTLTNIGIDYQFKGDLHMALDCHRRSNELRAKNGLVNAGASYGNMALIYSQTGNHEKALELQNKVLELAEKHQLPSNKALCLANIGKIYYEMNDLESAEKYYLEALELSTRLEMKSTRANCLSDLGQLKVKAENYEEAFSYFNQANEQYEHMDAKYNLALINGNRAQAYILTGELSNAINAGNEGLLNALESGNPDALRVTLNALYRAHYKNGSTDNALVYAARLRQQLFNELDLNYLGFSEKERENYFLSMEREIGNYYDFGVHYYMKYPSIADTMYTMALRNKGLSLKSSTFIRQAILNSNDSLLIQDYNALLTLKKKVANQEGQQKRQLLDSISSLERKIIEKSGAYRDFDELRSINWTQVRDGLVKGEAAIEFIHYTSEIESNTPTVYAALIITKDSEHPRVVRLCTQRELQKVLEQSGNDKDVVENIYGKNAKRNQLYHMIWQPLLPHLEGIKSIYYSPSGLLHKIAFAALSNDQDVLICDAYSLYQQSSTGKRVLEHGKAFTENEQFLLIGGVQYNSSATQSEIWSYLPGTEKEVNSIGSYLTKKKRQIIELEGEQAKETAFKEMATTVDVIHISTHGFFFPNPDEIEQKRGIEVAVVEQMEFRGSKDVDSLTRQSSGYLAWNFVRNKNPLMRSGLILAGANDVWQRNPSEEGEDGVLTAQEVANMNLNTTDLVVLSACETGLGDIKGSEGVFGLQRAFKMAGATNIIMSLWQVPDKETAEFMELFYQNLIKKKDIHAAFQRTQRTMRKKYSAYYWAAFVLIN